MTRYRVLLGLAAATAVLPANGGVFTVGSYTFDEATAPTSVTLAPLSESANVVTRSSGFVPGPGFDVHKGIGDQFIAGSPNYNQVNHPRHAVLGDEANMTTLEMIRLAWSTPVIANQSGDDVVVFENGYQYKPEGYAVRFRKQGSSTFSAWRYEFANEYYSSFGPGKSIQTFATAFNLQDFGFGTNQLVAEMEIMNLTNLHRVNSNTGQGIVFKASGASQGFLPKAGPLANFTFYGIGTSDPDITYVAGIMSGVGGLGVADGPANPEPGTLALLGAGCAVLLRRRRR